MHADANSGKLRITLIIFGWLWYFNNFWVVFLGSKVWSKTNNSLKAVKTTASFTHALKTHARKSDNLESYFLLSFFIIIYLSIWNIIIIIIIIIIIHCLLIALPLGRP